MSNTAPARQPLLEIEGLIKRFGGLTALAGFTHAVYPGEIVALIGPNGAGKTTLFNVLSGFLKPDSGRLRIRGHDATGLPPHRMLPLGLARTFQHLRLIGGVSLLGNVLLAFSGQLGENLLHQCLYPRRTSRQERGNTEQARQLLDSVGLAAKAAEPARELSYGQQKLLTMACVLATGADVMLLDEPIAGVNPRTIESILDVIRRCAAEGKAVIMIEHNIRAVEEVAQRVVFLDQGSTIATGTPSEVLNDGRVLEAYLA